MFPRLELFVNVSQPHLFLQCRKALRFATHMTSKALFALLLLPFFLLTAKGRQRPAESPASKGSVPCQNCGGLQLVTWKGGGYNMTPYVSISYGQQLFKVSFFLLGARPFLLRLWRFSLCQSYIQFWKAKETLLISILDIRHRFTVFKNVAFEFWHFPPIFVLLKLTCLITLFDRKLQVFKTSPKLTIFGILNKLFSTLNVNVAHFNRNAE